MINNDIPDRSEKLLKLRYILPIVFFVAIIGSSSFMWYLDFSNKQSDLKNQIELYSRHFEHHLSAEINNRIALIGVFQENWLKVTNESQLYNESRFMQDAAIYWNIYSGILGISWINKSGIINWVYPYVENNPAINKSAAFLPDGSINDAFISANESGQLGFRFSRELYRGGRGYTVYYPLVFDNITTGFFTLIMRTDDIIQDVERSFEIFDEFSLNIEENGTEIYSINELYLQNTDYCGNFTVKFHSIQLDCILTPTIEKIQSVSPLSSIVIFILGIILGLVTAVSIFIIINRVLVIHRIDSEKQKMERELFQSQKLDSLGTLAGGIAHDFNNILMGQAGTIEISMMDLDEVNSENCHEKIPQIRSSLNDIKESITRATNINRQILEFSRQSEQNFDILDLCKEINKTLTIVKATFDKSITFELKCPDIPLYIKGDSARIHQILLNLFINSKDAMPNGGKIKIQVEEIAVTNSDEPKLESNNEMDKSHNISLNIIDSGTGISPENLPHIFDPFFTTKGPHKGTGLGLSIVYQAIQKMKGSIEITSKYGEGTKVHIIFPKYFQTNEISKKTEQIAEEFSFQTIPTKKVLIVEDEALIGKNIVSSLKKYNINTDLFEEGNSALSHYKNQSRDYCLAILDINLPGMNGLEIYQKLREIEKDLHILFITGYCELEIPRSDPNVIGLLKKPFDQVTLLKYLKTCFDSKN